jgi:2-methylcitrate dehydratase PrpD
MTTTRDLVEWLSTIDADGLPERTVSYSHILVLDALGAGLYGVHTDAGRAVRAAASQLGAPGQVPVWGTDLRLEASSAALVNGTQAHACELDDYYAGAKCHPGAVVVPAALAAAEAAGASGRELIRSIVGGYEAMIRASLGAGANATRRRGWHLTGLVGPFGSAAAAAMLDGADTDTMLHALGIAGSHAGGLFAFSASGAMTKRFHAGRAAQAGLQSYALATHGLTGPPDVLEAADGGFLGAVSDEADPARVVASLGAPYLLEGTSIKPYSCCGSLHSSIDAVLELVREHDLDATDIRTITAHNSSVVDQQCGFPYRGDGGMLEAQMSLQYCLAVAAIDRAAFLPQFDAGRIVHDDVQALAQRVRFALNERIDAEYPRTMPARVTIETTAGEQLERTVEGPTGSPAAPFDLAAAEGKFRNLVDGQLPSQRSDEVVEAVRELVSLDDVRQLTALLVG